MTTLSFSFHVKLSYRIVS